MKIPLIDVGSQESQSESEKASADRSVSDLTLSGCVYGKKICLEWRLSEKDGVELLEHMPEKASSPWDKQIIYHQGFFFSWESKNRTQDPPKTCHFSISSFSLNFSISLTRSHVVFSSKHALLDWPSVQDEHLNQSTSRTYGVDFPAPRWSNKMIWFDTLSLFCDFKIM